MSEIHDRQRAVIHPDLICGRDSPAGSVEPTFDMPDEDDRIFVRRAAAAGVAQEVTLRALAARLAFRGGTIYRPPEWKPEVAAGVTDAVHPAVLEMSWALRVRRPALAIQLIRDFDVAHRTWIAGLSADAYRRAIEILETFVREEELHLAEIRAYRAAQVRRKVAVEAAVALVLTEYLPPSNSRDGSGNRRSGVSRVLAAAGLLLLLAFIAFMNSCAPTLPPPQPEQVAVEVIVADVSDSADLSRRCTEVAAQVHGALAVEADRLDLLVLATGHQPSAYEPTALVRWTSFREGAALFENLGASASKEDEFVRVVYQECTRNLVRRTASPIHRAIARAIEAIRARCMEISQVGGICARKQVDVASDLLEGVEPGLRNALRTGQAPGGRAIQGRQSEGATPPQLLVRDDDNISIHVCGIAQTGGDSTVMDKPAGVPASRLYEAWRPVFGKSVPPAFDPVCDADLVAAPATSQEVTP